MILTLIRAAFISLLVVVVPLGLQPAADDHPPGPIDKLVVFGDSLSDPGNAYIDTQEFEVRPFDPIPDAPYLIGRFHFTNGPTWIEQLTSRRGLHRGGRPALLLPGVYTNYAYGAGRARPTGPFHLDAQINLFLTDFSGVAAPETLYVVWIGSNDLRDALAALEGDQSGAATQSLIQAAVGATATGIQRLYGAGARSFLLLNLPNVGDTPALRAQGPVVQALGRQLAEGYNAGLASVLDQLDDLPGIVIVRFDVFAGLDELVDNPALAGLTNVTDSCITPFVIIGAICRHPNRYLFWDFIHPTTRAHQYLSEQVQATLETEFFFAPVFRLARSM